MFLLADMGFHAVLAAAQAPADSGTDWPTWVAAVASVLAVLVSGGAVFYSKRAAESADRNAARTEHGLTFRWACEQLASGDESARRVGRATLTALTKSDKLDDEESDMFLAVAAVVLKKKAYAELERTRRAAG